MNNLEQEMVEISATITQQSTTTAQMNQWIVAIDSFASKNSRQVNRPVTPQQINRGKITSTVRAI
jgi:methyl-accepting chemotaxis protein